LLRVFLVEDESFIRETLRDTVPWGQYGYIFAGEAGDGEIALPMIRQTKPDVLITDIRMPFMDGLALSKLVLSELPKTKVIIISGYDDFEYAHQAIDIGVEQFLLKPVTKSKLLEVLEHIREKNMSNTPAVAFLSRWWPGSFPSSRFTSRPTGWIWICVPSVTPLRFSPFCRKSPAKQNITRSRGRRFGMRCWSIF